MNLRINSTHTYAERGLDMYATPDEATRALMAIERLPLSVADPAAGNWAILDVLKAAGHITHGSDIFDYGHPYTVIKDYLAEPILMRDVAVITNPPYKLALEFVQKSLSDGTQYSAFLLRLNWLESMRRKSFFEANPPSRLHIFSRRLPMSNRLGWTGKEAPSNVCFAWFLARARGERKLPKGIRMTAYFGLLFVFAAVLFAHRQIPAYRATRARRRGLTGTAIIGILLGLSWAACGFPKSGPITVQADGTLISNVEITAPPGVAGINLNGHAWTSIYNVIVHHADKPGILAKGGHGTIIQNAIIDSASPNPGDNITCSGSPGLWVSNSRLSNGARGVAMNHCDGSMLSDLEGHDQSGAYPGGQFIAWLNSSNGSLQNFSNTNVELNHSGGDVINAWRSKNIRISSGLIDGNYTPNGVGIQADEGTSNMVVTDVNTVHMMNGGFAAYGAGGNSILFANVRTRDMLCSSGVRDGERLT